MGLDITYHPASAEEIRSIYFAALTDQNRIESLVAQFDVKDVNASKLWAQFVEARNLVNARTFEKGHAFYVAVVFGFLRKYHYLQGASFSLFARDNVMARYMGDLNSIVPEEYRKKSIDNRLLDRRAGGVYLTHRALAALRKDYASDADVRLKMDEVFSQGRLTVFWRALDHAVENRFGLLEASGVVEPNPFNLDLSHSCTNLFNCHLDGALLYEQTARQRFSEAMKENEGKSLEKKKGLLPALLREQVLNFRSQRCSELMPAQNS
jgi:hypothetical protein